MLQSKKLNIGSMVMVLMGVVMAIMITFTATNAWFGSNIQGQAQLGTSSAINLEFAGDGAANQFEITFDREHGGLFLLPSEPVEFNIRADVVSAETEFIIRTRVVLVDTLAGEIVEAASDETSNQFLQWLTPEDTSNPWTLIDGWYYQGVNGTDVTPGQGGGSYAIITGTKRVPHDWDNSNGGTKYTFHVIVQAMQARVWAADANVGDGPIELTTTTVPQIFDSTFQLILGPGSTVGSQMTQTPLDPITP